MVLGVAGVGKTEFTSYLSHLLKIKFIDLPHYVKRLRLHRGYDRESRAYIIDLRVISNKIGAEFRSEPGAVATIYPFKPRGVPIKAAVVLRLRPDALFRVLRLRKYVKRKIAENLAAELVDQPLISALRKYGEERVIQLDVTGKNLRRLAREFATAFSEKNPERLNTEIDWITELENLGKLDEILSFISRYQR